MTIFRETLFVFCVGLLVACPVHAQDCLKGDVNRDGTINIADLVPFQDALTGGEYQCEADGNYDGVLDLLDASPFLEILLNQQDADFENSVVDRPGDFFWSTEPLGFNTANEPLSIELYPGQNETLYLYYSINGSAGEIKAGAGLNVAASQPGVIQFTEAGAYNFSVEIQDTAIDVRWRNSSNQGFGTTFDPARLIKDDLVVGMTGTGLLGGFGMTQLAAAGDPFLDSGYSAIAGGGAFLYGKVEFTAIAGGDVSLIAGPNDLGIANEYDLLDVTIAAANIHVILSGDVNLDGAVNLLDVAPFIELLSIGGYQVEADCNYDGTFNLLDVNPFIDKLSGG